MFVLEDLWWGNVVPCEKKCHRPAAFTEKVKTMADHEATFREKLSAEDAKIYDQVLSLNTELSAYESCDAFVRGFRMGAQTILDVISHYDNAPAYELNGRQEAAPPPNIYR